jgi:16S rRNA (guanine1207-N2)-methyltransferase
VGPLRKQLQESLPELQSLSKHHGVVFWFEVPQGGLKELLPRPAEPVRFDDLTIPPGVFSADGPDPASVMLAGFFDGRLSGRVADFGAGWGYLGAEALKSRAEITTLASYEADWRSSEACRSNLVPLARGRSLTFHWIDLASEPVDRLYDWVIMNPPFHEGRAARPQIGIGFIEAASRALKPGGKLLMVANRNLPYEAALETRFHRVERLAEANGFKVIEANR